MYLSNKNFYFYRKKDEEEFEDHVYYIEKYANANTGEELEELIEVSDDEIMDESEESSPLDITTDSEEELSRG